MAGARTGEGGAATAGLVGQLDGLGAHHLDPLRPLGVADAQRDRAAEAQAVDARRPRSTARPPRTSCASRGRSRACGGRGRLGSRRARSGTPAGRPSMMATSSGPCDSPAVSTRSIRLVSHDRQRASRRGRRPRRRAATSRSPVSEDAHLQRAPGAAASRAPRRRSRPRAATRSRARSASGRRRRRAAGRRAAASGVGRGIRQRRIARQRRDRHVRGRRSAVVERTPRRTSTPEARAERDERLDRLRAAGDDLDARRAELASATSAEVAVAPAPTMRAPSTPSTPASAQGADDAADVGVEAARAVVRRAGAC